MKRVILLVLTSALAAAQQQNPSIDKEKLDRIRKMSPEERKKLQERLEQLKKLPPEEQVRLKENLKRLNELPPDAQKRIREKVQQITPDERKLYAELASGFFKDFKRFMDGFPRVVFFVWIKNARAAELERIKGLEPADRKDAFVHLYDEFKWLSYQRTLDHVRKHKCVDVSEVEALDDLSPYEFWSHWQKVVKTCQEKMKAAKGARENGAKHDRK